MAATGGLMGNLASELEARDADVVAALEDVAFPVYVTDIHGRFRAENAAALALFGDVRGRLASTIVVPEDRALVERKIAQKLLGREVTNYTVTVRAGDGSLVTVDVTSVPLKGLGCDICGIFGLLGVHKADPARPHPDYELTPREREVLGYLVRGSSTRQMAAEMQLSTATVRNHVRRLLRALGVHSRLEAVALARRDLLVT